MLIVTLPPSMNWPPFDEAIHSSASQVRPSYALPWNTNPLKFGPRRARRPDLLRHLEQLRPGGGRLGVAVLPQQVGAVVEHPEVAEPRDRDELPGDRVVLDGPREYIFVVEPSFGFRSTRNGANAPGQMASIIATSIDDDLDANALASCEYDASDAAGCGTTFTLMPVCWVNFFASARSRWWLPPTESPMNVIDCPPYLALIAAAFGTGGAASSQLPLPSRPYGSSRRWRRPATPARRAARSPLSRGQADDALWVSRVFPSLVYSQM